MELYNILKINNIDINEYLGGGGIVEQLVSNTNSIISSINSLNSSITDLAEYYKTTFTDNCDFYYNFHTSMTIQDKLFENKNLYICYPNVISSCTIKTASNIDIKCLSSFTCNEISTVTKLNIDCLEVNSNIFSSIQQMNVNCENFCNCNIFSCNVGNFLNTVCDNNAFRSVSYCNIIDYDLSSCSWSYISNLNIQCSALKSINIYCCSVINICCGRFWDGTISSCSVVNILCNNMHSCKFSSNTMIKIQARYVLSNYFSSFKYLNEDVYEAELNSYHSASKVYFTIVYDHMNNELINCSTVRAD